MSIDRDNLLQALGLGIGGLMPENFSQYNWQQTQQAQSQQMQNLLAMQNAYPHYYPTLGVKCAYCAMRYETAAINRCTSCGAPRP